MSAWICANVASVTHTWSPSTSWRHTYPLTQASGGRVGDSVGASVGGSVGASVGASDGGSVGDAGASSEGTSLGIALARRHDRHAARRPR